MLGQLEWWQLVNLMSTACSIWAVETASSADKLQFQISTKKCSQCISVVAVEIDDEISPRCRTARAVPCICARIRRLIFYIVSFCPCSDSSREVVCVDVISIYDFDSLKMFRICKADNEFATDAALNWISFILYFFLIIQFHRHS